jgi:hypothetical protein
LSFSSAVPRSNRKRSGSGVPVGGFFGALEQPANANSENTISQDRHEKSGGAGA